MGYAGHVEARARARAMRAEAATIAGIATELGVAPGTVSRWVRDVEFNPGPRSRGNGVGLTAHPAHLARAEEVREVEQLAREMLGELTEGQYLAAGAALYAAEGAKREGALAFANTDPAMVHFFLGWLRFFFAPDESRLRVRLYLHEGLDLGAAQAFWSQLLDVPASQFTKPYRAVADGSRRVAKHPNGCATILYSCSKTHRLVIALGRALLTSTRLPG